MARGYFSSRDYAKRCRNTKTAKMAKVAKAAVKKQKNLDFTAKLKFQDSEVIMK
jgi:hypothetical protein